MSHLDVSDIRLFKHRVDEIASHHTDHLKISAATSFYLDNESILVLGCALWGTASTPKLPAQESIVFRSSPCYNPKVQHKPFASLVNCHQPPVPMARHSRQTAANCTTSTAGSFVAAVCESAGNVQGWRSRPLRMRTFSRQE
jgi:hypothetical protein